MFKKRYVVLLLLLALLLCACGANPDPAEELAFPGTRWNMTPEELAAALGLPDGYETAEKDGAFQIILRGCTAYGASADVVFSFGSYQPSGQFGLEYIQILYPEGTDAQAVRSALVKEYGSPMELSPSRYDADYRAHTAGWNSSAQVSDVLKDDSGENNSLTALWWSDEPGRILAGTPDAETPGYSCAVTASSGLAQTLQSK